MDAKRKKWLIAAAVIGASAVICRACAGAVRAHLDQLRPFLLRGNGEDCRDELALAGVRFTAVPDRAEGAGGCRLRGVVQVGALGPALMPPARMTCRLAHDFRAFVDRSVQPLALDLLKAKVVSVHHLGTYACRPMRGGGWLSEHAYADAIDVASFRLSDGRVVAVRDSWRAGGARQEFIRAVAKAACGEFTTVLTPDYNAMHADHLHLDDGMWRTCGM